MKLKSPVSLAKQLPSYPARPPKRARSAPRALAAARRGGLEEGSCFARGGFIKGLFLPG